MQLKIKRSQRTGGMMSKNVIFCLDARVDLTQEERHLIDKYKLGSTVIYSSEASRRHQADSAAAVAHDTVGGLAKGFVKIAMARLSLNITIDSLCQGHHIEAKNLDEMMGAEAALNEGCGNLRAYLDLANTFDGREVVIEYNEQSGAVAA